MNTSTLNKRQRKNLEWLQKNDSVWRGQRLTGKTVRSIFRMMQVAGLYSYKTSLCDAQIVRHIRRIQGKPVTPGQSYYRPIKGKRRKKT